MKIFEATINDREINKVHDVTLAVLESDREKELYEEEDYNALLENTDYTDDDIFYYINAEDIPQENIGTIAEGDVYDFFSIVGAALVADA